MRFSLRTMTSGACSSISFFNRLLRLITRRYRSFKSDVAKRPPSSGTSGRSSGGITGITSRIIHSGLLPDLRNALDHPQALGELELLLLRRLRLHALANLFAELFDVDLLEQLLDALGAHHGDELAGVLLVELPLVFVGDDLARLQVRRPRPGPPPRTPRSRARAPVRAA